MRLLEVLPNGDFHLTENLHDNAIPRYAILSHRWENDDQEVTFEDMDKGSGRGKAGYKKIEFCGEQAKRDGLQYFWVDSCCIDKSNFAEHQKAINSMFRWYQRAAKCYAYLCDVSTNKRERCDENAQNTWERAFRTSKWFTRGWTLQELLAPASVEFFSRNRTRLGDKSSLQQQIHQITGIDIRALQGERLTKFSVKERFSWIERREVTIEEDKAYSLLGIFDVYIPLRYSEGVVSAFKRLQDEIDKQTKCIRDLRVTNPRDDKKRIEDTKGGLLADSYHWVLENNDFKQWRHTQQSQLLWVKGDPGKGKTMLLCGIINELMKTMPTSNLLSYFFCQATDLRINDATAVLRGILYLLIDQQPSLVSHIQEQHDRAGKTLFEDANAWVALSDIFTKVLQDQSLRSTYIIIDALDECTVGLPKLLRFITQNSSLSPHVKWLVSSRNWPPIEEQLDKARNKVRLCLGLNSESISEAVSTYILYKVRQLAQEKGYDDGTRDVVLHHLSSNANSTFLWVALVCQNLQNVKPWNVIAKLNDFPPGLNSLYGLMMGQIDISDDADLCKRVLAAAATVYRPVSLKELASVADITENITQNLQWLAEIIGFCGSFLTIREDIVYFVHQSAKDYLLAKSSAEAFPRGIRETHHEIFSRSLEVMSRTLRRDIYSLGRLGYPIEEVQQPDPDPLATSRYSCMYWVDHLFDWNLDCHADQSVELRDGGAVDMFVRTKFLYWLEALSLFRSMPKAVFMMAKLEALVKKMSDGPALLELVQDGRRFIMYHKQAIQSSPLQVYASALIFSPAGSLIMRQFKREEPQWITMKPAIGDKWSACLQTLEGHSNAVMSVAFSHDSTRLASASDDRTVRIWDASSGEYLQTLEGHSQRVMSVAFSYDSMQLASASYDHTVRIWDANSGECLQTLEGHSQPVMSIAFSHDST